MSFYLHDDAVQAANRLIFVTGVGRSGTTMMGRIIHSMEGVEYGYEPPMIFSILPLVRELREDHFRLLFESYLYEELFMGQITGRSVNLNRSDESCVYTAKPESEISARRTRSWTKLSAAEEARSSRLAVKAPDFVPLLAEVQRLYPGMRVLVIHRHGNAVINSALGRGWWSDETLTRRDVVWPSRNPSGLSVPWFVEDAKADWWLGATELERAAYYYYRSLEGLDRLVDPVIVSYERLIADPVDSVRWVADRLGLEFGQMTASLVDDIRERTKQETDWVSRLPEAIADRVRAASELT